jgi:hypothetical protein
VELSQVAQRNLKYCKDSFNACVEKGDYAINYMPYGLESAASAIMKTDNHFLRYCVPMDNQRPQLDLKFYKDICPDENGESLRTFMTVFDTFLEVPVIVVFTKHDQFLRNVEMHLFDYPDEYPDSDVSEAAKKQFREHYLHPLGDNIKYVRLESKFGIKYGDCILMLCERDAQTRRALWRSH